VPEPFLLLKVVHVLAAIVAVGSNVTYGFWLARAGRDREQLLFTISSIRWLDRSVANPGYVILLLTGIGMVVTGQLSFTTGWIATAIVLYVIVAILGFTAFAPAIRRQLAEAEHDPTSAEYAVAAARSTTLGLLTTGVVLVIVTLMVMKPF
jgi:uncharacterized membrane protein